MWVFQLVFQLCCQRPENVIGSSTYSPRSGSLTVDLLLRRLGLYSPSHLLQGGRGMGLGFTVCTNISVYQMGHKTQIYGGGGYLSSLGTESLPWSVISPRNISQFSYFKNMVWYSEVILTRGFRAIETQNLWPRDLWGKQIALGSLGSSCPWIFHLRQTCWQIHNFISKNHAQGKNPLFQIAGLMIRDNGRERNMWKVRLFSHKPKISIHRYL